MLATKPDVIFIEALGSTDATYLAEVKQLNGGKMIFVIGTAATIDPTWFKAVSDAIGVQDLLQYFQANDVQTSFNGPGYNEFKTNILASASDFADAPKYVQHASTLHLYDGIIMTALAMTASKSTDPRVYNPWIFKVGNGTSGATVVNTYKEGVDALNGGKQVRLVGAGGATNFNKWNNSQGGYIIVRYTATGDEQQVSQLSEKTVAQIIQAGGGG